MARTNLAVANNPVRTHEGGVAHRATPEQELRRSVMTCLLWEDTFYESGQDIATRIADLVKVVDPAVVAELAVTAREKYQLRHVPLLLVRELARRKGNGKLVENTLYRIIQRADELSEFVALYWKEKKQPLSAGVKRGLAAAFTKFDEYRLAKYNRDTTVKLRDVLFLVHGKPLYDEQAALWKRLVDGTLPTPDTWEVALSAGADKKATFERLLREGKLGGLAVLRNLRNMQAAGVDEQLIRERIVKGIARALPFRFITAARYAPKLEDVLEQAMFLGLQEIPALKGRTGLLIDVSGSMHSRLSDKAETLRLDAANGLAILLREKAEQVSVATFSDKVVHVAPRHGFALRDAIVTSQHHSGTYLAGAIKHLRDEWRGYDRVIIITDEQSHDGCADAFTEKAYLVNVAPYQYGVSYHNGWTHIDGWSERVLDYIQEVEES